MCSRDFVIDPFKSNLSDFTFSSQSSHLFGLTDDLEQVLLLQLTAFPVIIVSGQFLKLSQTSQLTIAQVPTANVRQIEISQVDDPSGMWNSLIAEEGSLNRGQGTVQYYC